MLFTLFFTGFAFSQNHRTQKVLDSLETELSAITNDTIRLKYLNVLGRDYALYSNKKHFEYNRKAIELAKKINYPMAIAEAYANKGSYYERQNDTVRQLELLDKIITLGNKNKDNNVLGKGYFEKGFYYWTRKNKAKAEQNFLKAEKFFTKANNIKYLSDVYIQFGFFYQEEFKDYNRALEYYKKYTDLIGENSFSLVNTYIVMAELFIKQSKYEKALEYYLLSEELYQQDKAEKGFHYGFLLKSIGEVNNILKNYDKSFYYFDLSLQYFLEQGEYGTVSLLYLSKAFVFKELNQSDKIIENIRSALQNIEKTESCTARENIFAKVGYLYFDLENYVNALEFHLKAYRECNLNNTPYKLIDQQEYNLGATYLELAQNIHQITTESVDIPKNKTKLLLLSEKYLSSIKERALKKGDIAMLVNSYYNLSEVFDLQHNRQKAFEYYKQHIFYKDSLKTIENRELLIQNQMQFEFDQQEKIRIAEQEAKDALTREELAKEKSRKNTALAGVGVFVILAGFSGFAYYQKKRDHKIIAYEKQKSDNLLLNILPEEVAEELKEKGTSEARHFENVSIMFTDFKDFTKLSEKIPSKELIEELNYCFKAFDEIIVKHGVEKIKTIGDSYMAVCGLPAEYGNHAQKMVQAALEIRDFIEDYKIKRQKEGKSFFEMRIGINSGEVVAGIVGIKKFAYDIWGDAVNTASRMESNGQIGKVNISEPTYNLVKDDFEFEHRGEIETKGKGKINMYFVENKNAYH